MGYLHLGDELVSVNDKVPPVNHTNISVVPFFKHCSLEPSSEIA